MCGLEDAGCLRKNITHLLGRKRWWLPSLTQPGSQRALWAERHDEGDVGVPVHYDLAIIKERKNMGMIDSGKNLRLSLEEEQSLLCCMRMKVRNAVDAYHLHCHLPTAVSIFRKVDFPQGATSKQREETITATVLIIQ